MYMGCVVHAVVSHMGTAVARSSCLWLGTCTFPIVPRTFQRSSRRSWSVQLCCAALPKR